MLKKYGFFGFINLIYCFIRSRFISNKIRIIRFPIDIRNRHQIEFGKDITFGRFCRIETEDFGEKNLKKIIFGKNIQINDNVHISSCKKIIIGDNVLIASKVFISDSNHGNYSGKYSDDPTTIPKDRKLHFSEVEIKKNCWIGENVCILKGITIGEG